MRIRLSRTDSAALVSSLALHILAAALFLIAENKETPAKAESTIVEIEVRRPETAPDRESRRNSNRRPTRPHGRDRRPRGRSLGELYGIARPIPNRAQTAVVGDLDETSEEYKTALARDMSAQGSSEWQPEHWGYGANNLGELRQFLKYDALVAQIDGILDYPWILARKKISGTILVRMKFTDRSECDWSRIDIKPGQRYLQSYVRSVLKKTCSLQVVKELKANRRSVIDLAFNFALTTGQTALENARTQNFVNGNVIGFHREAPQALEYHIGPFRGFLFVPYIDLDIPLIVEKWDEYVNGKDPMAPFKN